MKPTTTKKALEVSTRKSELKPRTTTTRKVARCKRTGHHGCTRATGGKSSVARMAE
jgi:hypothetical protein